MPREFATRALRALLAVWFVLSVGEPSVVHFCPMHASAAAELAYARMSPFAMQRDAAHGAAGHHAQHGASSHSQSSGQHQHHCTCIDCCIASASSALVATGVELPTTPVVAVLERLPSSNGLPALEAPPHLLPPSTGPPRA